jgi:hypothetical protein
MNKNIIITSVLVILVVASISSYFLNKPISDTTPNMQNIILSPLIKGCAETDKGMTTKSIGDGTEQEPKIEVDGNRIKYSRAVNHLCCRKAEIEKGISGSTINIFEDWSGIGCKCMCFSEIEATLSNVPSGSYVVNVYEKGTKPGSDEQMEQKLIITRNINVQ